MSKLDCLGENERRAYLAAQNGAPFEGEFDSSIFCNARVDEETGEMILYIPADNRIKLFRLKHPNGRINVGEPKLFGQKIYVHAEIFANATDGNPVVSNNAECKASEPYAAEAASTRAISRALRVLGFDLPAEPRFIEGWTPIEKGGKVSEDALESSVRIDDKIPDMSVILKNREDAGPKAKSTESKILRIPKKEAIPVPEPPKEQKPADPFEVMVIEAQKEFPTVEAALSYNSSTLSGKTLGEMSEADRNGRVKMGVTRLKAGKKLQDEKLAKAILVVGRELKIC